MNIPIRYGNDGGAGRKPGAESGDQNATRNAALGDGERYGNRAWVGELFAARAEFFRKSESVGQLPDHIHVGLMRNERVYAGRSDIGDKALQKRSDLARDEGKDAETVHFYRARRPARKRVRSL